MKKVVSYNFPPRPKGWDSLRILVNVFEMKKKKTSIGHSKRWEAFLLRGPCSKKHRAL